MARVQVSDEVWASYRAGLGVTPVNVALGKLVEREVGRQRRRAADDVQAARLGLEDARSVAEEIEMLITRLEQVTGGRPVANSSRDEPPEPERGVRQAPLEGL
jgi:hypothetical protein